MSYDNQFVRQASSGAEGQGAEVKRLFPVAGFRYFDPFVLWDEFSIRPGTGFPDHPHRGFEGITYVIDGAIRHTDNLGNNSTVYPGGLQRFTAGRGIVHSEMPSEDQGAHGIQLWVNLPAELKTLEPDYQQVNADEIDILEIHGGCVRELSGGNAALKLHTEVIYQDVELKRKCSYSINVNPAMRGLVYVLRGELTAQGRLIKPAASCFIEKQRHIDITAETDAHFMLCFGVPHNQPVYQHGSFVD